MEQNPYQAQDEYFVPAARVVTLDRQDEHEIVLRFLDNGQDWGQSAQQIRLDVGLAEQLRRLLTDELEDGVFMAS